MTRSIVERLSEAKGCVHSNTRHAHELLEELAGEGSGEAMGVLATIYNVGVNEFPQDYAVALEWAEKGAALGDPMARKVHADFYSYGRGIEADYDRALDLYMALQREDGFLGLETEIGRLFLLGSPTRAEDYETAEKWLRLDMDKGFQYESWLLRRSEDGSYEAFSYCETAMLAGWPDAVNWWNGDALAWAEALEARGETRVLTALARLRLLHGGQSAMEEVVRLYRRAAEGGDVLAQTYLGVCYANGMGVKRSQETADQWFGRALRTTSGEDDGNLH